MKKRQMQNNIRNTWKLINNTTKKQKLSKQTTIFENGNVIKTEDAPNKFINYFSSIAQALVSEIPTVDVSAETYLNNSKYSSFFMSPIVSQEVTKAIINLKNNGSGLYKISCLVLQDVNSTISSTLSTIFNLCIGF